MVAIDIIIAVDTQGALATGRVVDHAYMVDSHGFVGSWTEGQPSLSTVCEDGDVLTWRAVPVAPTGDVSLVGFDGDMVSSHACNPEQVRGVDAAIWGGRLEARGVFASLPYTLSLSVHGQSMRLGAALKVV